MTAAVVAPIKTNGIAGEQPPHESGDGNIAGFKQKMKMVGDQGPGIAPGLCFCDQFTESGQKSVPVLIIAEDLTALGPFGNDVVHCAGRIYSGLPWHAGNVSEPGILVNIKI